MTQAHPTDDSMMGLSQADEVYLFGKREKDAPLPTQVFHARRYFDLKSVDLNQQKEYLTSLQELTEWYGQERAEAEARLATERLLLDKVQPEVDQWRDAAAKAQEAFKTLQDDLRTVEDELARASSSRQHVEADNHFLHFLLAGEGHSGDAATSVKVIDLTDGNAVTQKRSRSSRRESFQPPGTSSRRAPMSLPTAQFPHLPSCPIRPSTRVRKNSLVTASLSRGSDVKGLPTIPEAEMLETPKTTLPFWKT